MAEFHDCMPVVLSPEQFASWLDYSSSKEQLLEMLKPCPSEWLKAHKVSTLVNSPRNDTPECMAPLTA